MAFVYLFIAVVAEVLATSALKATNGFTAPLPIIFTVVGYAVALFFLGLTFKSIPMGLAYALWSGAGIILISSVGWIYFKQSLDVAAVVGLGFMIVGIMIIHVFSKSTHL